MSGFLEEDFLLLHTANETVGLTRNLTVNLSDDQVSITHDLDVVGPPTWLDTILLLVLMIFLLAMGFARAFCPEVVRGYLDRFAQPLTHRRELNIQMVTVA